ncbi:uncharacterized protein LOC131266624 [Anopheles coustani]|uniref:uncharacterized protein LOC131266624 n=1 Tax=Anopheles coustani TaxID=139045 RepID=UPI00265B66B6|nr:uncharacterized protein LOC131266624 [Anopheles coustani]
MNFPEIDIEAVVELWFRMFPDGKASINYALQSPQVNTGANLEPVQRPRGRQELVFDIVGMAKDLVPTCCDIAKVWDDFRQNGYNDMSYDLVVLEAKENTLPLKNISNQQKRRALRNGAHTSEDHCVFCFNNKAEPVVYKSHRCKDQRGLVSCPILRKLMCPFCKATGPMAHTPKYCPIKPIITPAYCEAMERKKMENKWLVVHKDMNRRKSMRL